MVNFDFGEDNWQQPAVLIGGDTFEAWRSLDPVNVQVQKDEDHK